jgi:hypothetical protein
MYSTNSLISVFTTILIVATFSTIINAAAAPLEPANGNVLLGAWVDSVPQVGDTPAKFNERIGRNASFFQFSEDMPLDFDKPIPIELLQATETNADLYITIYPPRNYNHPYDMITDQAILDLGRQIAGFVLNGQRTFIRLFPEMNGNWNTWGQQPIAYKSAWKRIVTDLRTRMQGHEQDFAVIWAPSVAQTAQYVTGYPFRSTIWREGASNLTEFDELDTNMDGKFDNLDDPYSPYYPGDEWVDWVGASIYYYGVTWPWEHNQPVPSETFDSIMNGYGKYVNLYTEYSIQREKPMFITESGASFHMEIVDSDGKNVSTIDPGIGEVTIKQQFWSQYITNKTYLDAHPKIKAICLFEFSKVEETTLRDFRVSKDGAVLDAFKADLATVDSRYVWAATNNSRDDNNNGNNHQNVSNASRKNMEKIELCWILVVGVTIFLLIV